MTRLNNNSAANIESVDHYKFGSTAGVLSSIYDRHTNLSVWDRSFSAEEVLSIRNVLSEEQHISIRTVTSVNEVGSLLNEQGKSLSDLPWFCDDVTMLVDMYCYLFDKQEVGIRLQRLSHAMCPRFHVDKLPCRLVTTYQGPSTEWLFNEDVTRTQVEVRGQQQQRLSYSEQVNVNQLSVGDVALLKGDGWIGNEIGGIIHRSPNVDSQPRLFLSIDAVG